MTAFKSVVQAALDKLVEDGLVVIPDTTDATAESLADTIDKDIETEFPKHVVPKNKFIESERQRKENRDALQSVQTELAGAKETAAQAEALQKTIDDMKAKEAKAAKDAVINDALTAAGAQDVDYMRYKLGEIDDTDSELLNNKIKDLQAEMPHQFKAATDEDDEDNPEGGADEQQQAQQPAGFKVIDNGIKKNKQTKEDAIRNVMDEAFGFKK